MHLRCMTFREHPPVKIASGDGGCYIMHLRCMTFREHPPVKIAFGDGGCYIMHLRCMTLITQIVLCAVQKVNEKKENKLRKMYSAQI